MKVEPHASGSGELGGRHNVVCTGHMEMTAAEDRIVDVDTQTIQTEVETVTTSPAKIVSLFENS